MGWLRYSNCRRNFRLKFGGIAMKKCFFTVLIISVILSGCNEKVDTTKDGSAMPAMVEVTIVNEDKLNVGEQVELSVQVKQGKDFVNDADEVVFEVWESGLREQGVKLDGKLKKDGTYAVHYTFDHDGVYYMFAHTTARSMHVMPKMKLIVGNPDMSKVLEDTSKNTMNHGDGEENEEEHNGH